MTSRYMDSNSFIAPMVTVASCAADCPPRAVGNQAREPRAGRGERVLQRRRRLGAVDAFAVADEDVLRREPGERVARRAHAEQGMQAERAAEVAHRTEHVRCDERPCLR